MLRTMKAKALALGGESAVAAVVEQAAPAEAPEEQPKEGGAMAARITEKSVSSCMMARSDCVRNPMLLSELVMR